MFQTTNQHPAVHSTWASPMDAKVEKDPLRAAEKGDGFKGKYQGKTSGKKT